MVGSVVALHLHSLVLLGLGTGSQACAATGGGGTPTTTCTAATPTISPADPGNGIQNFNPMNGALSADGQTLTFTCPSQGAFAQIDDGAGGLTYVDTMQQQPQDPNAPAVLTLNCAGNAWTVTIGGQTQTVAAVRCLAA